MKRSRNHNIKAGDTFGRLTVIKEIEPHVNKCRQYRMVSCLCVCGNVVSIRLASITCGQTISCGCLRAEFAKTLSKPIHGLCSHPLYTVWEGMIQRCHNLRSPTSKRYGRIGVSVCSEWRQFKPFYEWAIANGWKEGLEIDKDKLSPTKPGMIYSPDFCCFLTRKENSRYKFNSINVIYNGVTYPLVEACEIVGLSYNTVSARIKSGLSFELSVSDNYKPKTPDYTNRTKRAKERKLLPKNEKQINELD